MSSIPAAKEVTDARRFALRRLDHAVSSDVSLADTDNIAALTRSDLRELQAMVAELSRLEEIETLMTWFGSRTNLELDHRYEDEDDDGGTWRVHSVNGGVNDREWTLVGIGRSPIEAIRNAKARLITKGGAS